MEMSGIFAECFMLTCMLVISCVFQPFDAAQLACSHSFNQFLKNILFNEFVDKSVHPSELLKHVMVKK